MLLYIISLGERLFSVQIYNAATTHEGRSAYKFVPCKARSSKDHWKKSSIHEPVSDLEDVHTLLRTN